jgi:hypothetical protein
MLTPYRYLIDRNPDMFSHVLDFLRGGARTETLRLPSDAIARERVLAEFDCMYCLCPITQCFSAGSFPQQLGSFGVRVLSMNIVVDMKQILLAAKHAQISASAQLETRAERSR